MSSPSLPVVKVHDPSRCSRAITTAPHDTISSSKDEAIVRVPPLPWEQITTG